MYGKAFWRKESIVNQPRTDDGTGMNAAHVGVARHVVKVIEGEDAAGQGLEKTHPFGLAVIFLAVFLDRERDVFGPQFLARCERTGRTAA